MFQEKGPKSLSSGNARVRCLRVQERSTLREGPGNTTVLAAAAHFRATLLATPARAGLIGTESTNCPEPRPAQSWGTLPLLWA